MDGIKHAIRESKMWDRIESIQCHALADVCEAATSLGFFDFDFVEIEPNVFDYWCNASNSEIQDKIQWRLTVTLN